jgi:hypothetical protein
LAGKGRAQEPRKEKREALSKWRRKPGGEADIVEGEGCKLGG